MYRPCFLVIDYEYPGNVSSRKLVLETAKFNVITAYSNLEAVETLRRFPEVDGVVLNAHSGGMPCAETADKLHAVTPRVPIVVTSAHGQADCGSATHHVPSFDPARLLDLLQEICAERTAEIEKHDLELRKDMES